MIKRLKNLIIKFVKQCFAFLKVLYYNTSDLIFQHLPVREKIKNTERKGMRNGYVTDMSTSVDIRENVELEGEVIKICERVIYKEKFQTSSLKRVIKISIE